MGFIYDTLNNGFYTAGFAFAQRTQLSKEN
jgi:glutathionyl-hydroquinone reductase